MLISTPLIHTVVFLCLVPQVLPKEGTVTASAGFNANADVAVLDKAIKAKGEV